MAKIDEIRKQLANQNLISIEELQPYSIPEIIHEHELRIQELELSKQDNKNTDGVTLTNVQTNLLL